jgi:uncharacterized protein (TIGR02678 family)
MELGLTEVLTRQTEDERERALRALLRQPLLLAGSEELVLVRRHAEYLREWFAHQTGWRLHIERGFARLYKTPGQTSDATRGAPGFDRERYALLCLVCAALERSEVQITLQQLGERLLDLAAGPELRDLGFFFTLESQSHRRALVHVCRFLIGQGVLARVEGDEETYVNRAGDVLYDINRRVLAVLPGSPRGASLIAAGEQAGHGLEAILAALTEEYVPDTEDGRRTALRHRLSRQLLDDPVVYQEDLSEPERQYLASQRGPLTSRLGRDTGLTAELRAEGMALVDPDGELSDRQLPEVGTQGHATLLLAEHLARAARTEPQRLHSMVELATFIRRAADEHARYWRRDAREAGAEAELAVQAIEALEALRLVQHSHGGIRARPALLRYAVQEPQRRGKMPL